MYVNLSCHCISLTLSHGNITHCSSLMLDKDRHRIILSRLLIAIYRDSTLSRSLGFKGGTAALFFYELDRFSTDLDFDLLSNAPSPKVVQTVLHKICSEIGEVREAYLRTHTIFFLISYGAADMNIKIEISLRDYPSKYTLQSWKGLSLPLMTRESILSNKLVALTERRANRDIYDVYFFLKADWNWDSEIIHYRTGLSDQDFFGRVLILLEERRNDRFLEHLGEVLMSDKQKAFVKNKLIDELIWTIRAFS